VLQLIREWAAVCSALLRLVVDGVVGGRICLPACLSVCLPACLSVCLSACVSVCVSVCLSVCVFCVFV
jgi:hypothetical protein